MYEYLDRPPQVGDVVEIQKDWKKFDQPLGKLSIVLDITKNFSEIQIIDNRDLKGSWYDTSYFKVVKTKPGNTAEAGDTVIRIANGVHPTGTTHTVYKNFGEGISKNRVYYTYSCSIPHTDVLVLCKATKQTGNPFKVGDRVRCISNPNSSRKIGDEFTVVQVHNDDVYYKDGFAAYYKYFELVSRTADEPTEATIRVGSHWSFITDNTDIVKIVKVNSDNDVTYKFTREMGNTTYGCNGKWFLQNYKQRPDLDNQQGESTQVESTNQTTKEQPMTIQQLLQTLFGAEKPTTDYDKRPAILVVAYNRDGSQMGQAIADNIDQVKAKVADTPELWGCKVLTYTLDQEVSVEVPVKATKAKVAKPAKE